MEQLTLKEIYILVEALNLWEKKNNFLQDNPATIDGVMNVIVAGAPPDVKKKIRSEMDNFLQSNKRDSIEREEEAILLKAKLIRMKQQLPLSDAAKILNKDEENDKDIQE